MSLARTTNSFRLAICWVALLPFLYGAANSVMAETVEVQVEHGDGVYHIYFEILLNAPADGVMDILSDYGNLQDLAPSVISSKIVSGTSGADATVEVTLKPCVWRFCKTIRKTTSAHINIYGAIVHTVIAEDSSFKSGKEQVIVKRAGTSGPTRVTYNANLEPDFFVPPLLGSWLIRRFIVQSLETTNTRIEQLANQ
jgi:hypothetical protein